MSTLQTLKAAFLLEIGETSDNTRFSEDQQKGFLNGGLTFLAVLSGSASDLVQVTTQENVGAYTIPNDKLIFQEVYFGDTALANDTYKLDIITRKFLGQIDQNWLDETSSAAGKPRYLIQLDPRTFYIHPRPNATYAGKKVMFYYGYAPALMANDSDTPDLPYVFHDLLPIYAAHLAHSSVLNPGRSKLKFDEFIKKYTLLKDVVDRESEDTFRWKFMASE